MAPRSDHSNLLVIDGQRLRIRVRRGRRQSSTPLLICNGLGVNLETLDPLVDALDERTVIRFDAPGTGGSSTPLAPYSIDYVAGLVDAMLARLGHTQVDVMGIS